MKIRNGFVSNSSSSSFVVIEPLTSGNNIQKLRENFEFTQLVVDQQFGCTEFGWSNEEYNDLGSKIIFAYLQAIYLIDNDWINNEEFKSKGRKWLTMLEEVIKDKLKVSDIIWNLTIHYGKKNEGKDYAYIDHQSASYEGSNTEIFDDEYMLTNFLFNTKSYIQTGNDNE